MYWLVGTNIEYLLFKCIFTFRSSERSATPSKENHMTVHTPRPGIAKEGICHASMSLWGVSLYLHLSHILILSYSI